MDLGGGETRLYVGISSHKLISPDLATTIIHFREKRDGEDAKAFMSAGKDPYERNRIVTGKELSTCFDRLKESLGRAMVKTITYELESMFGILFVARLSYKLSEVEGALRKLLGESASEIMMESIVRCLGKK